jgi:N-carbamoylputrescine amidase
MKEIVVAALQAAFTDDPEADIARVVELVRGAAAEGARVILPPELFQGFYFCREEHERHFARAVSVMDSPAVQAMQKVAAELGVVIPTSFFEKDGPHHYNSLALVNHQGVVQGVYRKSHSRRSRLRGEVLLPPGKLRVQGVADALRHPGGGDLLGPVVPECARAMMLMGADLLLLSHRHRVGAGGAGTRYPPALAAGDARARGVEHRPVVASNRTGHRGRAVVLRPLVHLQPLRRDPPEIPEGEEGFLVERLDLAEAEEKRAAFGFFRDRRPDLYGRLARDE